MQLKAPTPNTAGSYNAVIDRVFYWPLKRDNYCMHEFEDDPIYEYAKNSPRNHNPLMSIPTYRAVEPLYIVMLRNNNQAEPMFKTWIRKHQIDHATVSGNRMMLHHQQAFDRFLVTWTHEWTAITVWDTWNRRHIYVD